MKRSAILAIAVLSGVAGLLVGHWPTAVSRASDHDDGETEVKARNLNITDVYAFREDWQTGVAGDAGNLILIMNTNPRSLARQQYYFSTRASYDFHVSVVGNDPSVENDAPRDDARLRFTFGAPDAANVQEFTIAAITSAGTFTDTGDTTPITAASPTINTCSLGGTNVQVFAGLREDPFFFDVEQFFRVRAGLAGFGPSVGFRAVADAVDFAAGYNVNAIVVRVPIAFLAGSSGADVFDVWETISIPGGTGVHQ